MYCALGVVERDEDGQLFSFTPSLPGACSQGNSPEEALENLKEALAGCIESYKEAGERIPWIRDVEAPPDAMMVEWVDVHV
jgi:predicted RNase H-like HicB family nuclease